MRREVLVACLSVSCCAGADAADLLAADVAGPPSERASLASLEHPAIAYLTAPLDDPVARLNRKLAAGQAQLEFSAGQGYLPAVLQALGISSTTQLLVFSKTSLQRRFIGPATPRAIYFNDDVAVAFIHGAPLLELAALDPSQGVIFYTMDQQVDAAPRAARQESCLSCHLSRNSMDVPGMLNRSMVTGSDGRLLPRLGNYTSDHRSVLAERWGGWYVTGRADKVKHLGNRMVADADATSEPAPSSTFLDSLSGVFDTDRYDSAFSDAAVHLVFDHQMHMSNLLIRMGWEARVALSQPQTKATRAVTAQLLANDAREVVDYLLFVDEAPLPGRVSGTTQFATEFAARGPHDAQGRTLRQLDLETRLLRYPCSYMIYSAAFDALPQPAQAALYSRMWEILSGRERGAKYRKLDPVQRRAVIEILRATKPDLPAAFR